MSGSQRPIGLTKMKHPEFGEIKYSTVYFKVNEPILFTCFFDNTPDKYVGVMVEDFESDGKKIQSWYFVGVSQNELRYIESTPGGMKKLFESRPLWWCNRNGDVYTWKKQRFLSSSYSFCDRATLS